MIGLAHSPQASMLSSVILDNKQLSLLPIAITDTYLEDFHEYSVKEQLYKYLEYSPFKTLEQSRSYLEKLIQRSAAGDAQYWFICLRSNGKVVGTLGAHSLDEYRKSVEIGYGVSPDYWGKGVFTNAARTLIDYLHSYLDIHRIVAKTASANEASSSGLKKLGFIQEGVMRDFYRFDGGWHDASLFGLLRNK